METERSPNLAASKIVQWHSSHKSYKVPDELLFCTADLGFQIFMVVVGKDFYKTFNGSTSINDLGQKQPQYVVQYKREEWGSPLYN